MYKYSNVLLHALTVSLVGVLLCFGLTTPTTARTPNFIDHSDSFISPSIGYEYSTGKYEPINSTTGDDTSFSQSTSFVQVILRPTYYAQFYGMAGIETNSLADTDTEQGSVFGGGGQIMLDSGKDLYLKAIGSYYVHEELGVEGSNAEIKFIDDWQGGFLLGRTVESEFGKTPVHYNAYMGVLYSDRRTELTQGGSTTEFEQSQANGASIFGGVTVRYSKATRIQFEGEGGAMSSGKLKLIYTF